MFEWVVIVILGIWCFILSIKSHKKHWDIEKIHRVLHDIDLTDERMTEIKKEVKEAKDCATYYHHSKIIEEVESQIGGEEFINSIIERINCKQLKR